MKTHILNVLLLVVAGLVTGQLTWNVCARLTDRQSDGIGAVVLFDQLRYSNPQTRCGYLPGFMYFKNMDDEPITGLEHYSLDGTTASLRRAKLVHPESLTWRQQKGTIFIDSIKPRQEVVIKMEMEHCILGPSTTFNLVANQRMRIAQPSKKDIFLALNRTGRGGFSGAIPDYAGPSLWRSVSRIIEGTNRLEDKEVWLGATSSGHPNEISLNTSFESTRIYPFSLR